MNGMPRQHGLLAALVYLCAMSACASTVQLSAQPERIAGSSPTATTEAEQPEPRPSVLAEPPTPVAFRPTSDVPWQIQHVHLEMPGFVGSKRDDLTFEVIDDCVVVRSLEGGEPMLVTVPEGGGRPFADGTAIQIPHHRITLGSGQKYRVAGWTVSSRSLESHQAELVGSTTGCPEGAFVVLEVSLPEGTPADGSRMAINLGCNDEPFQVDCGIRVSTWGGIWVPVLGASDVEAVELLSTQVEGLAPDTAVWSTTSPERLLLDTANGGPDVELIRER